MHVCVVPRKRPKPSRLIVPTAENKSYQCLSVEHFRFAQDFERCETPIDAVHAEVGGKVVCERIAFLVERFDECDVERDEEVLCGILGAG